jgi:hypothetical protein
MKFGRFGRRVIEANFEGGAISSDGGLMLIREVDRRLGLSKAVAKALHDPRDKKAILHPLRDLIAQPVWSGLRLRRPERSQPSAQRPADADSSRQGDGIGQQSNAFSAGDPRHARGWGSQSGVGGTVHRDTESASARTDS